MTGGGWRDNWERVRTDPPTLERLRLSLIWGICHVHARVEEAEDTFSDYVLTGRLTSPILADSRARAIETVHAWLYGPSFDFDTWLTLPPDARVLSVMFNVRGLGAAKAVFALTSGGFLDVACLDSHMYSYRLNRRAPSLAGCYRDARRCLSNLRRYYGDVTSAYGHVHGSGYQQWADYEQVNDTFRDSGHDVYFYAIGAVPMAA